MYFLLCYSCGMAENPTRTFFILALMRSGSTWLRSTLDAHPDITCLHEPASIRQNSLIRRMPWSMQEAGRLAKEAIQDYFPLRYYYHLKWLDTRLAGVSTPLAGAKLTLPNLFSNMDFASFFIRYRRAKFIWLDRQPMVDALCSYTIAHKTQVWHSDAVRHDALIEPFAIPLEKARDYMLSNILYQEAALLYCDRLGIEPLRLTYEALFSDQQKTIGRVTGFLGVAPVRSYSSLKKLNTRAYSELITNYGDLLALERELKKR